MIGEVNHENIMTTVMREKVSNERQKQSNTDADEAMRWIMRGSSEQNDYDERRRQCEERESMWKEKVNP